MGELPGVGGKIEDSGVLELTGKIMVAAVLVLFLVVILVFFFHMYAKWFWKRRQQDSSGAATATRRRRFDFAPGETNVVTTYRRGLDPSIITTIPVVVFSAKDFKDGLECAVCLSEVSEGEKARLLPKCNHGFHVECIDMWFQSHSTCPLCRNPVSDEPESTLESILQLPMQENAGVNGYSTESPNFPTNVLFWGDETHVSTLGNCLEEGPQSLNSSQPPAPSSSSSSSSSSTSTSTRPAGTLAIDIPSQIHEDEQPKSPVPTRLRSLKRLLSRDRRISPRSPRDVDVEQQTGRC